MRHPFVDLPASVYNDYYAAQVGGGGAGLPYFAGGRYQRGHGLGSLLSGVLRNVVSPTIGRVLKREVPKRLLRMGANVLQDVARGTNLRTAVKNRGLEQVRGAVSEAIPAGISTLTSQLGLDQPTPQRRGPPGVPAKKRRISKKRPKRRDIFS